jgi:predicted homoserine dehydrogenase-like protein
VTGWRRAESAREAAAATDRAMPVLIDDPFALTGCDGVDVVVEATGTIELAAAIVLDALEHGKYVVMVNTELDRVLRPILNAKAVRADMVMTHTDGQSRAWP